MKLIIMTLLSTLLFFSIAGFSLKKSTITTPETQQVIEQKLRSFFKNDNIKVNVQFNNDEPQFSVTTAPVWKYPLPLKSIRILTASGDIHISTSKEATETNEVIVRSFSPKSENLNVLLDESHLVIGSSAHIENLSHNIQIEIPVSFNSEINIQTVSGDIKAENLNLKQMLIKTISGDIELIKYNATQTSLESISGEIQVRLNKSPDSKFTFKTETISGEIKNKFKTEQNAKNSLSIKTTSGDIDITESN